ncbi:MAG: DUF4156 domain-containing protein [Methyloprofundus sp.]|nr:DUF4156 domain-containing protein [Methyloprofundus sp.]MBW6452985.1 DUF4156 domain-containing protein [Methyloprofundus sp.]
MNSFIVVIFKRFVPLFILMINSCAIDLNEGAGTVQLIYTQPKKEACEFIGQASASDGGMVSGDFMSDANIHKGAANQMKNKAYEMGGNLVYIQQQFDENAKLTSTKTKQTMIGFVYRCDGLKQAQPKDTSE